MILPDVNLLVHAYNTQFPQHEKAKLWWEDKLAGSTSVALAWVTILGFIRVTTHARILRNPLTVQEAIVIAEEWLELPHFFLALPSSRHFPILRSLMLQLGTAGNLTRTPISRRSRSNVDWCCIRRMPISGASKDSSGLIHCDNVI